MRRKLLLGLLVLTLAGTYFCYRHVTGGQKPDDGQKNPIETVIGPKQPDTLEEIFKNHPIKFLEMSLQRYEEKVHSYRTVFLKRERRNGELQAPEKLLICFREKPFSVYMDWLEGAGLAKRSLYVAGENDGKILAKPNFPIWPVMARDVDGPQAKNAGRYPITEFGMYIGTKRALECMRAADKAGTLHVHTFTELVTLEETGNRPCFKLVRAPYQPPEEDGINHLTLYFDKETLLQVGSVLRDKDNQLIAEYFFRDIEINPTFDDKQFTREALTRTAPK